MNNNLMDKQLPLVSIVTPSYNKATFIEETILSVRKQTYSNIEHIVVDGGSKDGTIDILRKHRDILTWVSEPDKGQSDAINKGWKMAKGEILGWLNADDTYQPWAVETAVKFLIAHQDVSMVYGQCNIINEYGKVIGQHPATEFNLSDMVCGRDMVPQATVFLRARVLDAIGYLDTNLHMAMDVDLWIRIGLKFKIEYIPELLANFRVSSGTKTVDEAHKFAPDHFYILNKLLSDPALPEEIRRLKRRANSGIHLLAAAYSRGSPRSALGHCLSAILWHPPTFFANLVRWRTYKIAASALFPRSSRKLLGVENRNRG
jgi:glycosyltransferase involved in cell wall biosynthesis